MRFFYSFSLLFITFCVRAQSDYYIKFPDDIKTTLCDYYAPPEFYNPNDELITVTYEDFNFLLPVADACTIFERNWLIHGEHYDPTAGCVQIPNPSPVNGSDNLPANTKGVIISAPGNTVPGWEASVVRINWQDAAPTDYSIFYTGGTLNIGNNPPYTFPPLSTANCYIYKQFIKIIDTIPPTALNCPATAPFFSDSTANDSLLWNASYWFDPNAQSHDLTDTPVDLTMMATDPCNGIGVGMKYYLFLDLDQDGIQETMVNSLGYIALAGQIRFANANSPNYAGGSVRDFDQRTVPTNQKYQFGLRDTIIDSLRICTVAWHTLQAPNTWIPAQLPPGKHRIKWLLEDNCGLQTTCEYSFTVADSTSKTASNYYIKFPDDLFLVECGNLDTPPIIYNPDSLNITIDHEDQIFGVSEACYTITRNWIVKSDHYDPALSCTNVPNPRPNTASAHAPVNLVGVTVAAPGNTVPGWSATTVKIWYLDNQATDYSVFYSGGDYMTNSNGVLTTFTTPPVSQVNCFRYIQKIDVIDVTAPVVNNCPAILPFFPDSTANDSLLWNAGYWLDPVLQSHDLTEVPVDISVSATDNCSNIDYSYLLFLDLDRDGVQETVINSHNPPPLGQVRFNNANTLGFNGGTLQDFDNRDVPLNEKYQFGEHTILNGSATVGTVGWYAAAPLNSWVMPQLPPGNHRVKWTISDGCGNESVCEVPFTVVDSAVIVPTIEAGVTSNIHAVRISPNPAFGSEVLHFTNLSVSNAYFDLYDGYGRLLLSRPILDNQVLLSQPDLPTGLYYYKISDSKNLISTGKLSLVNR